MMKNILEGSHRGQVTRRSVAPPTDEPCSKPASRDCHSKGALGVSCPL